MEVTGATHLEDCLDIPWPLSVIGSQPPPSFCIACALSEESVDEVAPKYRSSTS